MDFASVVWLITLVITHSVAYFMGASSASDDVQMHEIDRKYEYMMWLKEREDRHDGL